LIGAGGRLTGSLLIALVLLIALLHGTLVIAQLLRRLHRTVRVLLAGRGVGLLLGAARLGERATAQRERCCGDRRDDLSGFHVELLSKGIPHAGPLHGPAL
jgi:hypothetical protein